MYPANWWELSSCYAYLADNYHYGTRHSYGCYKSCSLLLPTVEPRINTIFSTSWYRIILRIIRKLKLCCLIHNKNNKEVKVMLPNSFQQPIASPKVKATPEKVRKMIELMGMDFFLSLISIRLIKIGWKENNHNFIVEFWHVLHSFGRSWFFIPECKTICAPSSLFYVNISQKSSLPTCYYTR